MKQDILHVMLYVCCINNNLNSKSEVESCLNEITKKTQTKPSCSVKKTLQSASIKS